jgi:hypothetical protein
MKNTKLEKEFKLEMEKMNIMNKSSKRGIVLAIVVLFSISLILIPSNAYAEEINVESVGLDKTTIMTLTNVGTEDVQTFRIWLSQNANFESFKTEKGWVGEKTPQGVIIFTSSESIKQNESVKFGIKTDKVSPIINWKGLDQSESIIDTGVTMTTIVKAVDQNPEIKNIPNSGEILSDSTFKIIPSKPNSGSTIRVTGDQFGALQVFDFYINNEKIGNFETDENGFFITTMQIPKIQTNERVDFKIKDKEGQEKVVSLRLGYIENRIPDSENIKITVEGIENTVYRGDILQVAGTANPGSAVTITITDPEKITTNTRTAEVDNAGKWELLNPINVAFDAPFGKYTVTVSDGKNQILKYWNVESNKIILINPTKQMFEAGDLIKFEGTAIPNLSIELILENHLGDEMASDIMDIDDTGMVEFEYQTVENQDKEGTWTLIATQGENKEFTYVGYDEVPIVPTNLSFDKSNYKSSDSAKISFIGKPLDKLKMIIITPSGGLQGEEILIQLKADGRGEYELPLKGYGSGIYTAVVQKGNSQNSETFSVGLLMGSGTIDAKITQSEYETGERILLLGQTNPNSLLTATLIDPSGKEIKSVDVPSNNVGMFTEERLRIPSNAMLGLWKINVSSGSNLDVIEFNVFSKLVEGMTVTVTDKVEVGEIIKIEIIASHKTSINMEIFGPSGNIIDDTLSCNTTKEFVCESFWSVPEDSVPGTYKITVNDAISSDETSFEVLPN